MQSKEIEVLMAKLQFDEDDVQEIKKEVMLAHTWLRQVKNALKNLDPRLLNRYLETKSVTLNKFTILKYEAKIMRYYIKRFQAGKMNLSKLQRIIDVKIDGTTHAALLLDLDITEPGSDRTTNKEV